MPPPGAKDFALGLSRPRAAATAGGPCGGASGSGQPSGGGDAKGKGKGKGAKGAKFAKHQHFDEKEACGCPAHIAVRSHAAESGGDDWSLILTKAQIRSLLSVYLL